MWNNSGRSGAERNLARVDPSWNAKSSGQRERDINMYNNIQSAGFREAQFDRTNGYERGVRNAIMEYGANARMGGVSMGARQQGILAREMGLDPIINASQDRNWELAGRNRMRENWGWEDKERGREQQNWKWQEEERGRTRKDWSFEDEKRNFQRGVWNQARNMMGSGTVNVGSGGNYAVSGLR